MSHKISLQLLGIGGHVVALHEDIFKTSEYHFLFSVENRPSFSYDRME